MANPVEVIIYNIIPKVEMILSAFHMIRLLFGTRHSVIEWHLLLDMATNSWRRAVYLSEFAPSREDSGNKKQGDDASF